MNFPIIAIQPRSKKPIFASWQEEYKAWKHRNYLLKNPNANIGLLLGRIIDIEADTEEANNLLDKILNGYPHMRYSSHKSIHHLFINPYKDLTRVVVNGIEFRANRHQSLLPPSTHPDGSKYTWIRPSLWELTELPQVLKNICGKRRNIVKLLECYCVKCKERYSIPVKLFAAEKELLNGSWQCRKCRTVDLSSARKKLRHLLNCSF